MKFKKCQCSFFFYYYYSILLIVQYVKLKIKDVSELRFHFAFKCIFAIAMM